MRSLPGACAGSAPGARGGMKIIPIDKDERKIGCRVLTVSSQYTGDIEKLIVRKIGYIPPDVWCFTNHLGTRFYYFEEMK